MEYNFPAEPKDFVCIKDDTSIIGFQHQAYYDATNVDEDGFRSMSRCSFSWEGILEVVKDMIEIHRAKSVELSSVVCIGKGYFKPEITTTVIGTVTV